MKKPSEQVLLPPLRATNPSLGNRGSGLLSWLTEPIAGVLFLPLTGLWVLGWDWLLFSGDVGTVGTATPLTVLIGFLAGSIGAYRIQTHFAGDNRSQAWVKALLAGLVVGVPFPLAGTVVGGWILAKSGLLGWRERLLGAVRK